MLMIRIRVVFLNSLMKVLMMFGIISLSVCGKMMRYIIGQKCSFRVIVFLYCFFGIVCRLLCIILVMQVVENSVMLIRMCSSLLKVIFFGRNNGSIIDDMNSMVISGMLCQNLMKMIEISLMIGICECCFRVSVILSGNDVMIFVIVIISVIRRLF